jgi:hypothetical protein
MDPPAPEPEIHVAVRLNTPEDAFPMSRIERLVLRMGPPEAVRRGCDLFNGFCIVFMVVYFAGWNLAVVAGLMDRFHLSPAMAVILSTAWAPVVACQLGTGAVRLALLTLGIKRAEHMVAITEQGFHTRVADAVAEAIGQHMAGRAIAKPTLQ